MSVASVTAAIISSLILVFAVGSFVAPQVEMPQPVPPGIAEQRETRLEPALTLPSYTDPRLGQDFRDDFDAAQLAISSGNLIFYAKGAVLRALDPVAKRIVWEQPLPWLFTAWRDLLITADRSGLVTAYSATTRQQRWSVNAFGNASADTETRYLRVIDGLLIVNRRVTKAFTFKTSALEPASGRTIWSRDTPAPYSRAVGVARDRYIVVPTESDSPMGPPPSSFLDSKTGWYFERDASILNQSLAGNEFVKLEYLTFLPPYSDHELKESYTFRLMIHGNAERPALVQDLGVFDLTPPLECLGKQFFVGLYNGSNPAYEGKIMTTISEAVGFVAINADTVWLEVTNDCGRRLAYVSRSTRQVSYLNVLETLSLEQRAAQYRSSGGQIGLVQGHIPVQIRINLFGESLALATVRNAFALGDIQWLEERQGLVYVLLRNKELRIYDSSAKLLRRYLLALPNLQYLPERNDANQIGLTDRVFTWRSGVGGKSYFFALPI